MATSFKTPQRQLTFSAELRNVIDEHHIFTTRTRMKVLTALDNMTKDSVQERERSLRYRAIQEILTSEVSYLHQLEVIMKFFMEPLKAKDFVPHATYMTLFGHIESLYNVNGELLQELKKNPENIAATFLKLAPFFKLYSVYAYDYKEAMAVLQVSAQGRKSHTRYFVLFNDMLMYCKVKSSSISQLNSLRCCCILPLKKCTVDEILSKGMFKITCQTETLIVCSSSVAEGEAWITALRNAVKQYHECRQTLRKDSSSRRPRRRHFECDLSQEDLLHPVKKFKTNSKQDSVMQEQPLKDSLYPLRSSMKNLGNTPVKIGCIDAGFKSPQSVLSPSSINTTTKDKETPTQNSSQNWYVGTQMFRNFATRFRQIVQKHLLRRAPTVPFFR
ncbi:hypothetical protein C0J52_14286 [Blattella germanica]|nr:hypothetical protein C0J52_14286 [Blattella germanica]